MTSEGQRLASELVDLRRQVRSLSRASQMNRRSIEGGSIPIYDADGTYKGSVGVQPDGGTGVVTQNDPAPAAPSAPILEPALGGLTVTWDGTFAGGAERPSALRTVEVHASSASSYTPSEATHRVNLIGAGSVTISLPPDPYTVVFVAVTFGGARSVASVAATETPAVAPSSAEIDAARQQAADAQTAASAANTKALEAAGIAAGKGKVYYGTSAPAADPNGLWIDTSLVNGVPGNVPKRHNGTTWVAVSDAGIQAAATAAANANTAAGNALTAAQNAQSKADSAFTTATAAQTSADGKNKVFWRARNNPPPAPLIAGDTWFVTDEGNTPYKYVPGATPSPWVVAKFEDGAIASLNVGKLVTGQLAAGQAIFAGDPLGEHTKIAPDGVTVFADDPVDGTPNEITSLGRYIGVRNPDSGDLVASIDNTGQASFQNLSVAATDITIGGTTLSQRDWNKPWGVVGAAEVTGPGTEPYWCTPKTNSEIGLAEFAFTAQPGRAYELVSEPFEMWADTGDSAYLRIRWTDNGATPNVSTSFLLREYVVAPIRAGFSGSRQFSAIFPGPALGQPAANLRLLMTYGVANNSTGVRAGVTGKVFRFAIRDVGPQRPNVAVYSAGGGSVSAGEVAPPPPPVAAKTTITDTFFGNWSGAWMQSGARRNDVGSAMYQGNGDTFNAIQAGAWAWHDLTGVLAGAEINRVELALFCEWSWYGTGVRAQIGVHGSLNDPGAVWPGQRADFFFRDFGRAQSQWIDVSWWGNDIKSGAVRGITLYANSNDPLYYGRFTGVGPINAPAIRITYTR